MNTVVSGGMSGDMGGEKLRKIIHCDADCFFAALEMREDPSLRDKPIAVGGSAERRGVISTCNYLARTFGVHSAMPSAQARRLCPDLIIIPPNMALYRQVSQQMRAIFHSVTDRVEPLSLDEAFLDVSAVGDYRGSATLIAQAIRRRVADQLGITISAGVAPNKFLAKVASDWQKPDGLTVIPPDKVAAFVRDLPVTKIFGVGRVTAAKLQRLGVTTCGGLQQLDEFTLDRHFGSQGMRLYQLSRGVDNRPVKQEWQRKSLSVEHTYPKDLPGLAQCFSELPALLQQLHARARRLDSRYVIVKGFVKLKFNDFTVTTLERSGTQPCLADYQTLCREAYERRCQPVRLLGLGVRLMDLRSTSDPRQLELALQVAESSPTHYL